MQEIVKINLDNEMDLILSNKRIMKLSELCGLSLPAQTTFATAVSEIARCALTHGKKAYLVLGVRSVKAHKKELVASVFNSVDLSKTQSDALLYAQRLLGELPTFNANGLFETRLTQPLPFGGTFSEAKIEGFKEYFRNEPPISPYDEIRKKNLQLIELSSKLQQSEDQYRTLTDTLPLMMFAANKKGEVYYHNKWLKDFFPEMDFSSGTKTWQSILHADDHKPIWDAWDLSRKNKTIFRAQGRLRQRDNSHIWHLITIVPTSDESGIVNNWIGFFVDIHSQKLVEETLQDNKELKSAQAELEKYHLQLEQKIKELHISNKNLEQFAFIASHDLQEPLRKIKIFSNILKERLTLESVDQKYFDKVLSATDRMSLLIKDVLYYSQVSHLDNIVEDVDLNLILEDVLTDLEVVTLEKKARVTVGDLPVIRGVPLQFWQLFSNLLLNAIKFSDKPPVISITCHDVDKAEQVSVGQLDPVVRYNCIVVEDNGIGFDQMFAEKIFTIFQRLNDMDSPGTGIGLALCKKIVENHGGVITADGSKDQGATFRIFLPAEKVLIDLENRGVGVHI